MNNSYYYTNKCILYSDITDNLVLYKYIIQSDIPVKYIGNIFYILAKYKKNNKLKNTKYYEFKDDTYIEKIIKYQYNKSIEYIKKNDNYYKYYYFNDEMTFYKKIDYSEYVLGIHKIK